MAHATRNEQSNLEVELKFVLSAADVRKLCRTPSFQALQSERPRSQTLRASYYDTTDAKLAARGLSLRVRKESRRYVQCLKADAGLASSTGLARHEWEWPVPGPDLDAALLRRDDDVMALLKGINLTKLVRVYGTDIKRQVRMLRTPGGAVIECAIDQGNILADEAQAPLVELELELNSGDVRELLNTAQLIVQAVPARLSERTKAGRGLELARGAGATWVKARNPKLSKSASAEDVLRASVLEGLKHLIANEDCVLTRCHVEGVHQMRVALRRMRSVITTYKKLLPKGSYESLSQGLKDAGSALGPARDWDVFLDEVLAAVEIGFEHDTALAVMRTHAERRLDQAYRDAHNLIASHEYARLLCDGLLWVGNSAWRGDGPAVSATHLHAPATDVAKSILDKRHARLLRAGKGLKNLPIEQRHMLRIAIKKARYAAEFFAELYPAKTTRSYLRGLKTLQESLGHLNDLATAERLMAGLVGGVGGADGQALHRATGMVEGWYMHAQILREDDLLSAWKDFTKAKTFW
ncbi:CYTH and CHAD domain-containing protein [Magnetovibrio sp.]|uniref:CYTH and CHAD domain-containing protein n=1 Tax=Magnetovibrio sp. TaxID=2024836 RepID=UPI002F95F363